MLFLKKKKCSLPVSTINTHLLVGNIVLDIYMNNITHGFMDYYHLHTHKETQQLHLATVMAIIDINNNHHSDHNHPNEQN